MTGIGFALGFSGLAALSLGMDKHHEQALGREPGRGRRWALTLLGWCLLGWAAFHGMQAYGPSVGLAIWVSELAVTAIVALLVLSYRPRWLVPLALLSAVLAFLASWIMA